MSTKTADWSKLAAPSRAEKLTTANVALKAELAATKRRAELLANELHAVHSSRPVKCSTLNIVKPSKEWVRVCIPDTHGAKIDRKAAGAMLDDLKRLNPAEVVLLGDHVDCGGFLAQHHVMGYVAETGYSYAEDCDSANQFLNELQAATPRAKIWYIEGNHERRVETWCVTQTLRHERDAEMLRKCFAPEFRLKLKERGISYIRQGQFYQGLSVPGTLKLGSCFFTHGISTAKHAAAVHVARFAGNIVYGHTHRADYTPTRLVNVGLVAAWSPGCLCELQPLWQHTKPTDWNHGYAIQLVRQDGKFQHIQVAISGGHSLLGQIIKSGSK
jgi:predicted phosphodiesterase